MKKQLMIGGVFGAFLFTGNVLADCPSSLTVEQIYDCTVVEGAGDVYEMPEAKADKSLSQNQSGEKTKASTNLASAEK